MLLIQSQSLPMENWIFYTIIGILALIVGSFCNVLIYRLPIMLYNSWREECLSFLKQKSAIVPKVFNFFAPRSHCPKCQHLIPLWQNIPIISYIILRGKCQKCQQHISFRYPFVEVLSCIASLFIAYRFGISWQTGFLLLLTWALIVLSFIDFDHQLLPDEITLTMLWVGLLVNAFGLFIPPEKAILGATFGYGSLWLVASTFKIVRQKEGMGHGDFKLLAMFGAWLGWQVLPMIVFLASILGILVGGILILRHKRHYTTPMPFGPYLASAGWIMFFFGKNIIALYKYLLTL